MERLVTVYSSQEVATRLGLSDRQVRRVAAIYEGVHGPLGRDNHRARLFTSEVLEALEAAQQQVSEGRAGSLEAALVAARDGELPAPVPSRVDVLAVFEDRLARVESLLLEERAELRRENDDLKRRND